MYMVRFGKTKHSHDRTWYFIARTFDRLNYKNLVSIVYSITDPVGSTECPRIIDTIFLCR